VRPEELLKPEFVSRTAGLQLVARRVVEGFISGLHRSPYKGFSSEFSEFRHYIPGDELRYVDWKVYGKSDRLVVREFQEETNLKAYILLDCSRSMEYTSGGLSKFAYARFMAASLAYFLVRQQDSVGLVTFADRIRTFLKPGATAVHLRALLEVLAEEEADGHTDITGVCHTLAGGLKRRGLIILLSDLYDEQEQVRKAMSHFLHRKHEVIVYHLFDPSEFTLDFGGPVELLDAETGDRIEVVPDVVREDYEKNVASFIDAYREMARDGELDYIVVDTSRPFHEVLLGYLAARGRKT